MGDFCLTEEVINSVIINLCVYLKGQIVSIIEKNGLKIKQMKMHQMTRVQAEEFYKEHLGKPFFEKLLDFVTEGPAIGMELVGNGIVYKWRSLLGILE